MIFPESLQSTRWSVCSAESSLVSVVALPSLMMIQQNTPSNSLISVIQEISHSFIGGISNSTIWRIRHFSDCLHAAVYGPVQTGCGGRNVLEDSRIQWTLATSVWLSWTIDSKIYVLRREPKRTLEGCVSTIAETISVFLLTTLTFSWNLIENWYLKINIIINKQKSII